MSEQPISLFTSGPPTTVISLPIAEAANELSEARNQKQEERKFSIAAVVANWPRFIDSWVALAEETDDVIERYAYFRIAYHRGLDTLRGSGWKGSGYVRWAEPSNHGFLKAVLGLQRSAAAIGEADEEERCAQFLLQLDPTGIPENV